MTSGKKVAVLEQEESSSDSSTSSKNIRVHVWYGACQKNQAVAVGGYALDGCLEFMASDVEGTDGAMICHACGCNRNFHVQMVEAEEVV